MNQYTSLLEIVRERRIYHVKDICGLFGRTVLIEN